MNAMIDEACEVIAETTRSVLRTLYAPLLPGQRYYQLPALDARMMRPLRIWSHVSNIPLEPISIGELDTVHDQWERTTGEPRYWFPVSWDVIGIWPCAGEGGGLLRIDYQAWPRPLLDDADTIELPESSVDAVLYYGQYMSLLKHYDISQAAEYFRLFEESLGVARGRSGSARQPVGLRG